MDEPRNPHLGIKKIGKNIHKSPLHQPNSISRPPHPHPHLQAPPLLRVTLELLGGSKPKKPIFFVHEISEKELEGQSTGTMSSMKKVGVVEAKAGKAIDWDGMAKMVVSDEARKEFANLHRAFNKVNHTLQTKFSQEQGIVVLKACTEEMEHHKGKLIVKEAPRVVSKGDNKLLVEHMAKLVSANEVDGEEEEDT